MAKSPRLTQALGLLTATLFATGSVNASAQTSGSASSTRGGADISSDTSTDLGKIRVDTAILFYQEEGGRVQATEPVLSMTLNHRDGDVLGIKLTADTLTGATPNGAAPWSSPQTFVTPTKVSVSTTSTGASGNSIITTVDGIAVRNYSAAAHALPLDYGFNDQRYALDLNYSTLLRLDIRLSGGVGYSSEHDYTSTSVNAGITKDLNDKNTTLSLSVNAEFDTSEPYFGTPVPFSVMSGTAKGGNTDKSVVDAVIGITQVMNRYWLAQLNYNVSTNNGYQTDPYRILSLVDPVTGAPLQYVYENRPKSRLRQSVYFGNKIALGPTITDISGRYYHDSWGINSYTAELSERVTLDTWVYVEPFARYYHQTAATFFRNYLVWGDATPQYASSDSRVGQFDSTTFGLKVGFRVGTSGELYLRGSVYNQTGNGHPTDAIGQLKNENLFSGVKAYAGLLGYTFVFK